MNDYDQQIIPIVEVSITSMLYLFLSADRIFPPLKKVYPIKRFQAGTLEIPIVEVSITSMLYIFSGLLTGHSIACKKYTPLKGF